MAAAWHKSILAFWTPWFTRNIFGKALSRAAEIQKYSETCINWYFILSWAVRFTKATSLLETKMNSCRNTLYPLQNIKKCCSSSTWFCLQTKHLLSSTGMGTPQISYFPVCIRVQLEETQFWSLSQFWELLAENRTAVLPRMRGEGRRGVTPCF